jgi:predicted TIM-barrel fold metal-dependent hydrolase
MPTAVVNDSHCHFFSQQFFETLAAEPEAPPTCNSAGDLLRKLGWDPPGSPSELADRWVAELNTSGVTCAAIMSSVPGDEASVALAVKRHPKRLVGMCMLDLTQPDAPTRALRALTEYGLRCLCLFPAMHGYALDDDRVAALFHIAAEHRAMVFVHCGVLSVGVRKKLGLRHCFDARLGNPLALVPVASKHPEVPVIVPHFGGGFLRETLMAGDVCSSLHIDTSSSNAWTKYIPGLRLADVFRQALEVFSADRLLFGSDSSFFPRGWQRPIYEHQLSVMDELGLAQKTQERILGGNFTRLFGP